MTCQYCYYNVDIFIFSILNYQFKVNRFPNQVFNDKYIMAENLIIIM